MLDILDRERLFEFSSGSVAICPKSYEKVDITSRKSPISSLKFRIFKLCFDYGTALLIMPIIGIIAVLLAVLNPVLNPGPVFFRQERMGRHRTAFEMIKFRTMKVSTQKSRGPGAKLEEDRITKLGRFMRKARIDELPNFINVLRGEMSVVGPRPDAYNQAYHYSEIVEGYEARHRLKPGITGLAQVEMGYVESESQTLEKAKYDNIYVTRFCGRLDLYVIYRTFFVLAKAIGR